MSFPAHSRLWLAGTNMHAGGFWLAAPHLARPTAILRHPITTLHAAPFCEGPVKRDL